MSLTSKRVNERARKLLRGCRGDRPRHVERDAPSTGVDTHLALRGRGFFVVQTEDGDVLQRSGNFRMDIEGQLVNQRGQPVLTDAGPLEIPDRERIVIDKQGVVRTEDGGELGRLRVVDADAVSPLGNGQWRADGGTRPADNGVQVLGLSKSNADPFEECSSGRGQPVFRGLPEDHADQRRAGQVNELMRKSR